MCKQNPPKSENKEGKPQGINLFRCFILYIYIYYSQKVRDIWLSGEIYGKRKKLPNIPNFL